jgi:hypothetical protein
MANLAGWSLPDNPVGRSNQQACCPPLAKSTLLSSRLSRRAWLAWKGVPTPNPAVGSAATPPTFREGVAAVLERIRFMHPSGSRPWGNRLAPRPLAPAVPQKIVGTRPCPKGGAQLTEGVVPQAGGLGQRQVGSRSGRLRNSTGRFGFCLGSSSLQSESRDSDQRYGGLTAPAKL